MKASWKFHYNLFILIALVPLIAAGCSVSAQTSSNADASSNFNKNAPRKNFEPPKPLDVKHLKKPSQPCKPHYDSLSEGKDCYQLYRALHQFSANGSVKDLADLFDRIPNINVEGTVDPYFPALYSAVMSGHEDVVKFLLAKGADPNRALIFGQTPLKAAALYNFPSIPQLLIDKGANVCENSPDDPDKPDTALDIAKKEEHQEILVILINAGAGNCSK